MISNDEYCFRMVRIAEQILAVKNSIAENRSIPEIQKNVMLIIKELDDVQSVCDDPIAVGEIIKTKQHLIEILTVDTEHFDC